MYNLAKLLRPFNFRTESFLALIESPKAYRNPWIELVEIKPVGCLPAWSRYVAEFTLSKAEGLLLDQHLGTIKRPWQGAARSCFLVDAPRLPCYHPSILSVIGRSFLLQLQALISFA